MKLNELYVINLGEKQQLNEFVWMAVGLGFAAYEALRYAKKIKNGTMTNDDWKNMGTEMLVAAAFPGVSKGYKLAKGGLKVASAGKGGGWSAIGKELSNAKDTITTTINAARRDPGGIASRTIDQTLKRASATNVTKTVAGTSAGAYAGRITDPDKPAPAHLDALIN